MCQKHQVSKAPERGLPMSKANPGTAAELKKIVDQAEVAPVYFEREDGTEMAVVNAAFLKEVMAVYREATAEELTPDHDIYNMKLSD
jgi:hypothetical protein